MEMRRFQIGKSVWLDWWRKLDNSFNNNTQTMLKNVPIIYVYLFFFVVGDVLMKCFAREKGITSEFVLHMNCITINQ